MKYLIGVLVAANLLCLAWFNGWMAPLGGDPREPDRIATEIEPQRLRILPPSRLPADALSVPSSPSLSNEPSSTSAVAVPEPALRSAR
jgi:hypothetical protein